MFSPGRLEKAGCLPNKVKNVHHKQQMQWKIRQVLLFSFWALTRQLHDMKEEVFFSLISLPRGVDVLLVPVTWLPQKACNRKLPNIKTVSTAAMSTEVKTAISI